MKVYQRKEFQKFGARKDSKEFFNNLTDFETHEKFSLKF